MAVVILVLPVSACRLLMPPVTKLIDLTQLSAGAPLIARTEYTCSRNRGSLSAFPAETELGYDLRSYDLSALDLASSNDALSEASFDTDTVWPQALPEGFSPDDILALGKNPGLGVRALHEQGITGENVGIAIIDQNLLLDHDEYKENIMLYEVVDCVINRTQMHGAAVTSLAAGNTTGVAPDARVYYIASTFSLDDRTNMVNAMRRVLEINAALPEGEKIRVVSISAGVDPHMKGYDEFMEVVEAAKRENIFVVTPSLFSNYACTLMGLGRAQTADPDDFASYTAGRFWRDSLSDEAFLSYLSSSGTQSILLVPMDARAYAAHTDASAYAYDSTGGMSWACPWLAGLYALCAQVNPSVTPDAFLELAIETGHPFTAAHENEPLSFGRIANPAALVDSLRP